MQGKHEGIKITSDVSLGCWAVVLGSVLDSETNNRPIWRVNMVFKDCKHSLITNIFVGIR